MEPLASKIRPTSLKDFVGQKHLVDDDKPLAIAIREKHLFSFILWGPPGVGKTTLARIYAKALDARLYELSAVSAGKDDIRSIIEDPELLDQRPKLLFLDEIHRFNKSQQDALLPHVESGLFTFIGATTENPSFEVNSALLSRAQVYVLKSLSAAELKELLIRARALAMPDLQFEDNAIDRLIAHADGDARRLLNLLEQIHNATSNSSASGKIIDQAFIENALSTQARRFDKGGDQFYDQISALHKSVRGSNPDAALYWLCRMLDGGVDPRYLSRRIIRMAWEDIGLADPRAMQLANDAALTYERLGSPEGELALGQAVVYLAVASKSNASYKAFNAARAYVAQDQSKPVPHHLRNAPTKLMKDLGHGKEYRYAHDEPHAYAAGESYLPEGMTEPHWYEPVPRGLETQISEKMAFLRNLDQEAKKK